MTLPCQGAGIDDCDCNRFFIYERVEAVNAVCQINSKIKIITRSTGNLDVLPRQMTSTGRSTLQRSQWGSYRTTPDQNRKWTITFDSRPRFPDQECA
jgi:phosphoglycerol transferase MdoB-like AlkP superfamily enzyme